MNQVKAREESYQSLRRLASRIDGLPDGFELANRERKFIHQGRLHVAHAEGMDDTILRIMEPMSSTGAHTTVLSAKYPDALASANGISDSSPLPSFCENDFPFEDLSSFSGSLSKSAGRRSLLTSSRFLKSGKSNINTSRGVDIEVIIFSDLVLLAQRDQTEARTNSKRERKRRAATHLFDDHGDSSSRLTLLRTSGIGRVVDVKNVSLSGICEWQRVSTWSNH